MDRRLYCPSGPADPAPGSDERTSVQHNRIEAAWKGPPQCRHCGIRDLVLFADLKEEDFALIHLPIDEQSFLPGQVLYHAGDTQPALFTVREGLVKLVQYLPEGTQRIVRLLRQGNMAGLEVLVGAPYAHTAIALQPTLTCRIPRPVIERLSGETPRLHAQLMRRWHQSLQQADDWLTELATGNARLRLARFLLQLTSADGNEVVYLPTRDDLGAILGTTMETASRTVAEFRRQGLIADVGDHLVKCRAADLENVIGGG
jgi:CRP/FNR family transcriptional regulator, anaerobic regulatory protein